MGILLTGALLAALAVSPASGKPVYTPPPPPRTVYNFNPDWKFIRHNVIGAQKADFDDSAWTTVSTPHTFNDVDSYDHIISHSGGDRHAWTGIVWHRKHFKLPARAARDKVFLEFEGIRQAAWFWVNGQFVGLYQNGVKPFGLDTTRFVKFGDADNVIAVKVNNRTDYKEAATGFPFEWEPRDFNPDYGGLHSEVRLILTGKIYQTLPIYDSLRTTGICIYPSDFSFTQKTCDVHIDSQVRNESGGRQKMTPSAVVVNSVGNICAKYEGDTAELANDEAGTFIAQGRLANAHFWDVNDPYLYHIYCILSVRSKVVDVQKVTTGFRQVQFRGGVGTGGVYINGKFVWLTDYAERSVDDWAAVSQAYPDCMHDYDAALIRSTHANYIRWMHITPQPVDVRTRDRFGIVEICSAGGKEGDPAFNPRLSPGAAVAQWDQRVRAMRNTIILCRDAPSILFWEDGNSALTPGHMRQTDIEDGTGNQAKVPNKLIIYRTGGHGYGLHSHTDARVWPTTAANWRYEISVLGTSKFAPVSERRQPHDFKFSTMMRWTYFNCGLAA